MTKRDLSEAKDPALRGSMAAMLRAAEMARQVAIQTNTALITVQDGKIVRIEGEELRNLRRS